MHLRDTGKCRAKASTCASFFALSFLGFTASAQVGDDRNTASAIHTATPIKHVIIIVGENRSFDHLFATYVPRDRRDKVLKLLSEGIVNEDGSPGPNFAKAHQFQIISAPNGGKFNVGITSGELKLLPCKGRYSSDSCLPVLLTFGRLNKKDPPAKSLLIKLLIRSSGVGGELQNRPELRDFLRF